jgi:hypothetical protein
MTDRDSAQLVIAAAVTRVQGLMGVEEGTEEAERLLGVPEVRAAADALISAVREAYAAED